MNDPWYICTVCPGSSDPFYIVSYYIKWVTTYWTHSMYCRIITLNYSRVPTKFQIHNKASKKPITHKFTVFFRSYIRMILLCLWFRAPNLNWIFLAPKETLDIIFTPPSNSYFRSYNEQGYNNIILRKIIVNILLWLYSKLREKVEKKIARIF